MKKMTMLAAAVALTISACASGPTAPDVSEAEAKAAVAAAGEACKKTNAVGFEWRDACKGEKDKKTEEFKGLLVKAEKALAAGDFATAKKLADKSVKQSENAYAQYEAGKNAGPRY